MPSSPADSVMVSIVSPNVVQVVTTEVSSAASLALALAASTMTTSSSVVVAEAGAVSLNEVRSNPAVPLTVALVTSTSWKAASAPAAASAKIQI